MNRVICIFLLATLLSATSFAQTIQYSNYEREDTRDINFEIIGKMNNKILVYKNIRWKHKINIYDNNMNTIETVKLDFVPEKTFNIDFVAYSDHFIMIYQYQKGNILHCMAVKMDDNAQKLSEPVEVDTTRIPVMSNNKIYTTISSEDKQKIIIFKIQTRYQKFNLATMLFDNNMQLIKRSRYLAEFNDRKESYDNFLLTNDGNFIFTYAKQLGYRDNSNFLSLMMKAPLSEDFLEVKINLDEKYIDEVNLKIDNRNNRYILNTFYYKKSRGSIDGLFTYIYDKNDDKAAVSAFLPFNDSLRAEAKTSGMLRFAFDNFFIRQIVVKGDGGFILTAEDYSSDSRGRDPFNRYDYLYNPYYPYYPYSIYPGGYYYNPYTGYYRPSSFYGSQSTRYYSDNIFVLSISKDGMPQWDKILHKSQFDDDDENFLSFFTMTSGSEIHFLYNSDKRNQIVTDQGLTPDGVLTRYPTLKSREKGYEFMPSLSKQVGARQLIIPCSYRGFICFAKVDF